MKDARQIITHQNIYLFGLVLMVIGLPLSLFLMSISQFILTANFLIEGKYAEKWRKLRSNKALLVFLSIYLLHLSGLIYTQDIAYALKDLRIKAPIVILPLIMATSARIETKHFRMILLFFAGAVLSGTFISIFMLFASEIGDPRDISVFISHIRFSLNICLAIMILLSFIHLQKTFPLAYRLLMLIAAIWLVVFLFILQSLTGIVLILLLLLMYMINYSFIRATGTLQIITLVIGLGVLSSVVYYTAVIVHEPKAKTENDLAGLDVYTPSGNFYTHDTSNCLKIKGNKVHLYVCESELREVWNSRSNFPFDSLDERGNKISDIIVRYMTSMGLRKDGTALKTLNGKEIRMIEAGIPNADYHKSNVISRRISQINWEYQNYVCTGNPSGHSVLMRYEYWKAAVGIIRENFLIGVGTGDLNLAFKQEYEKMGSKLVENWRLRAHNQFLSIWIAFGLIGFLWFTFTLFYPPVWLGITRDYFFNFYFFIFIMSTLTEDTIESQAGVSFFAFFYALFLFARKDYNNAFQQ